MTCNGLQNAASLTASAHNASDLEAAEVSAGANARAGAGLPSGQELIRLREFAEEFRHWQREMTNRAFRKLLLKLAEAEVARVNQVSQRVHVPGCLSGVCE